MCAYAKVILAVHGKLVSRTKCMYAVSDIEKSVSSRGQI